MKFINCNRELLVYIQGDGLFPAPYKPRHDPRPHEAPLDPNHTHFLFVDDGRSGKYGEEIHFRARVEKHISETESLTTDLRQNAGRTS